MTTYKTRIRTNIEATQFTRPADPPGLPPGVRVIYLFETSGQLSDNSWIVPPEIRDEPSVIMSDAEFNAKHEIDTL